MSNSFLLFWLVAFCTLDIVFSEGVDPTDEICSAKAIEKCEEDSACVRCRVKKNDGDLVALSCLSLESCSRHSVCGTASLKTTCLALNCTWCSSLCTQLPCGCQGMVDACGVCDGNNSTCLGCDGIANSELVVDKCGICGGTGTSCFHLSSVEYIGIILAIVGNSLISISLNCQKHAHNMNEALGKDRVPYMQIKMWWVGQVLMVVGECGNFLAYAYAPATLVAPLGSVTVISNALIAHKLLKEPLFRRNIGGCMLAVLGSILIVLYAPQSETQLTMDLLVKYISEPVFMVFLIFVVIAVVGLLLTPDQYKRRYVVIYVLICSLTGCITVMCTKGLSTAIILTLSGNNQFKTILPWFLLLLVAVTVVIQIRFLNKAMISYGASEVVPVYYVLFTFCSVMAGIILFHELHEEHGWYSIAFLFGCLMTFSGVWLITSIRKDDIDARRIALLERAGLLEDPDELWDEADTIDFLESDDFDNDLSLMPAVQLKSINAEK